MNRTFLPTVGIIFALSASFAFGQANPQAGQSTERPVQAEAPLFLPGFWQLAQEAVRQEVDIVPDQLEKLKKIAKDFGEQQRELYAPLQNPQITPEERQAAYADLQKKSGEINQKFTAQVKDVLLPHQIKALEDIDFRNKASVMLQYPMYVDKLNLTPEQKEQVKKNRDALNKKIQKAQQEALDEVLGMLTPDQVDVLKQPWPAQGGWGGAQPRTETPKK